MFSLFRNLKKRGKREKKMHGSVHSPSLREEEDGYAVHARQNTRRAMSCDPEGRGKRDSRGGEKREWSACS